MNAQFQMGDVVKYAPEWSEPGEESDRFVIVEPTSDERGPLPRVCIVALEDVDAPIRPVERVSVEMIELATR